MYVKRFEMLLLNALYKIKFIIIIIYFELVFIPYRPLSQSVCRQIWCCAHSGSE